MIRPILALVPIALLALPAPAPAQGTGRIGVELNKLEQAGDACRTYFVFRNGLDAGLDNLRLDLFLFDGEGVILSGVAIDSEAVAPGRTRVRVFELPGLECGAIGQVLLNGVMDCAGAAAPGCAGALGVSSRAAPAFVE